MSITERPYEGSELTLFRDAVNWKSYLYDFLAPHLAGDRLLEVGSGLGGNVPHYAHLCRDITLLEPDGDLIAESRRYTADCGNHLHHIQGTTGTLSPYVIQDGFDAILYSDVLEHIEDSIDEVRRAAQLLRPGGRLVVIVPAYPALFSEFDAAIGHYGEIVELYAMDILADDALFGLAELHEEQLNDPTTAQGMYERLLNEYPGSLCVVEARKRFRRLRGDVLE